MADLDRRSTLALGLAGVSGLVLPIAAAAQTYSPTEGKEIAPGVRQVDLGQAEAHLQGYKTIKMRDIVFQPGTKLSVRQMSNDMICHMTEGELRVVQDGNEFTAKKGDVWTCAKGTEEEAWNEGDVVAIMRVTDLLSG